MTAEQLQQLCKANGIGFEFEDCRGQLVRVKAETQQKILRAMSSVDVNQVNDSSVNRILPVLEMVELGATIHIVLGGDVSWEQYDCTLYIDGGGTIACQLINNTNGAYVLDTNGPIGTGYHQLALSGRQETMALIVVPSTCYQPPVLECNENVFGLSLQLYTLRSLRNWGMGDFTDLKHYVIDAAKQGVDLVGVNPLHALFPANPLAFSPYSPSNRAFLNIMYIDPEQIEEFAHSVDAEQLFLSADFQETLYQLRQANKVDYAKVAVCKFKVFSCLFECFKTKHLQHNTDRAKAFYDYLADGGEPLRLHALHDTIHAHFFEQDFTVWGWPVWPEAYRRTDSEEVATFALEHTDTVLYYQYLQWCAEQQLHDIQQTALREGMAIGIYLDVAVGVNPGGSEAWVNQDVFCFEASTGAPPDNLATEGQNWGFPPLHPVGLRNSRYDVFIQNLQASMRNSGAVRFDHCVALMRLWWVPEDHLASDGAYVHYPFDELMGLLALESHKNECMVIGEDLGTVPPALRPQMSDKAMYAYRVMYFEVEKDNMLAPVDYTQKAVATINTHDVAPLVSWWNSSDIKLRRDLGIIASEEIYEFLCMERNMHKQFILNGLFDESLVDEPLHVADIPEMTRDLNELIHVFLAGSKSQIVMSQLEDWQDMASPVNIPGTFNEYPNWQRKLDYGIEGFFERKENQRLMQKIMQARVING